MGEAASVAPASAITYGAAPAMTHIAPPAVTYEAPPHVVPTMTYMGEAPMVESAPAVTYGAAPAVIFGAPAETYFPPPPVAPPANKSHLLLSILRFSWTSLALSQVTFCQLRLLRLPRSSLLLPFWSVASLFTLPRRPSYQSPPHLRILLRRLFHTPLPLWTLLRNSRSWSPWLHLPRLTLSALRVLHQSPRYLLTRLCRRPYTALQLRCLDTTTAHGVLYRVHPFQRSFRPPSFAIRTLQC